MITLSQLVQNQSGLALMTNSVLAVMAVLTLGYWLLLWFRPSPNLYKIGSRLAFLWVMTSAFVLTILYNHKVLVLYIWFIAFLALKEFFSMTPTRRADRRVLFCAYLSLPIQFILILLAQRTAFILFAPIHVFLVLPMVMVMMGESRGFLRAWSTIGWGIITTVYSLGHLAYLLALPATDQAPAGGSGLFLFLVALAQISHALQYGFGKLFPDPRLSLRVSKTRNWASLVGSALVVTPLAWWLAPFLTPFTPLEAGTMGLLIAIGAFIGYVILSAIKTDLQIKDRGTMTPGHGGVLNRIDSLIYTAPLFFYLVVAWHY
ncbi:MAG: phosphatidate cytidylyltransferase [Caldilineaceae bacterium]|nr:phosphatidate cytidylyltransferase [Caldilineaceae bacterium]